MKFIGQVAEMLGTSERTIRFYEEEGLIVPARSPKGTRQYTDENIDRLKSLILLLQSGMSVQDLQQTIAIRKESATGAIASSRMLDSLTQIESGIRRKMAELEQTAAEIAKAKVMIGNCTRCSLKPERSNCETCPVFAGYRQILFMNLIIEDHHDLIQRDLG